MGRRWDYSVPSAMVWSEVERVMKPGAHAMIFGGSRTFHRLTCAVEDGGFEVRDVLMWLYGSGFPKSTDISKEIDRKLGAEREVTGTAGALWEDWEANAGGKGKPRSGLRRDKSVTAAAAWKGQGTALKPAYEPILLARKFLEGNLAEAALEHGVGGLAIDACRIGSDERFVAPAGNTGKSAASVAPVNVTGYSGQMVAGRWPANVILSHLDECERVGSRASKDTAVKTASTGKVVSENVAMGGPNYGRTIVGSMTRPDEEIWKCVDGCPRAMLDAQSGNRPGMSGGGKHRADYPGGMFGGIDSMHTARGDSGGASRFFYTPKADRYQREAGLDEMRKRSRGENTGRKEGAAGTQQQRGRAGAGSNDGAANVHPTVKPIDLIRYLATLILPPKRDTPRRILVPFAGVSSEMIGCIQAGWDEVVGIEREAEYVEIARARISKGGVLSGLMDRSMRRRKK
jgi:hypothetical protein